MAKTTNKSDRQPRKTASTTSGDKLVQITNRERRLRERLLTVDEDMIHDEKRLHDNGERRKARLTAKINRTRARQEAKLDRQETSRLYHISPILYAIASPFFAIGRGFRWVYRKLAGRVEHHRKVTPHRSFYLTTHAQSVRQINISGYLRFVHEVGRTIWDNKWLYFKALVILTLTLLTVIGLGVHSSYVDMRDALNEVDLNWFFRLVGMVTQAILTSMDVANANNRMLSIMLLIISWMALIYIVRHISGGRTKLKLRDALYNSSGSLLSILIIIMVMAIQLLPLAIVMISYSAVSGAGYINEGIAIENMAAWCIITIVGILTIYWMITGMLSLITVTIPGIYPLRAYFETSVLVSGRRVKILLRVLMMLVPLALVWIIVLIPTVLIDNALKLMNFPLVQIITTLLVAASLIWISVYLYMLYRRLLDSPEQPVGTPNRQFVWPWQRKKRAAEIAQAVQDSENNSGRADAGVATKAKAKSIKAKSTRRAAPQSPVKAAGSDIDATDGANQTDTAQK